MENRRGRPHADHFPKDLSFFLAETGRFFRATSGKVAEVTKAFAEMTGDSPESSSELGLSSVRTPELPSISGERRNTRRKRGRTCRSDRNVRRGRREKTPGPAK